MWLRLCELDMSVSWSVLYVCQSLCLAGPVLQLANDLIVLLYVSVYAYETRTGCLVICGSVYYGTYG